MRNQIEIKPFDGPLNAEIRPPGSKSITNRALLCAAMAEGTSQLSGVLESDDSRVMMDALKSVGVQVSESGDKCYAVVGSGGRFDSPSDDLFVKNSGTTIRFLTAALAIAGGKYRLSGIERMHERPIQDLVDALKQIGIVVETGSNGCPPVSIQSERCLGGVLTVRGDISSQYLSGLMMAAPLAKERVEIRVEGKLISRPYVEMTQSVMASFGVNCESNAAFDRFVVEAGQGYVATDYAIEPDASAASYFWGAAAICGGTVKVLGLSNDSLQGDVAFAKCLAGMGCEVAFVEDGIAVTGPAKTGKELFMSDISDTVQTMAAVALFLDGATSVRGVAHNRVKETDRISDLARELKKFGAQVEEFEDGLTITPPSPLRGAEIETYDDHRMAMSLALVGLKQAGVVIMDPDCCAKTYPNYFEDLESLRPT